MQKIIDSIRRHEHVSVVGPDGTAAAFMVSAVYRAGIRSILVINPVQSLADRFLNDLNYFLGDPNKAEIIPAYETLAFEEEPPDVELSARRMAAFFRMYSGDGGIFVTPSTMLARRFIPPGLLGELSLFLEPGQKIDPQETARHLDLLGYSRANLVSEHGEYSIRGSIMDIFSPGWEHPLRLDLFGDTIEEMKWFDPSDQRSISTAGDARLIPILEVAGPDTASVFRERAREFSPLFGQDSSPLTRVKREIDDLGVRPWHTTLLPLFYRNPSTLFDFCPQGTVVFLVNTPDVLHEARKHLDGIARRGEEEGYEAEFIERFLKEAMGGVDLVEKGMINGLYMVNISPLGLAAPAGPSFKLPARPVSLKQSGGARPSGTGGWPAIDQIKKWHRHLRIIFVCRTGGSARRLSDILKEYGLGSRLVDGPSYDPGWTTTEDRSILIHVGVLREGFIMDGLGAVFVTEEDLFGPKHHFADRRTARAALFELDFSSLGKGDYLVHEEHGIGIFDGLERIGVDKREEDMLSLRYADNARLYVPMDQLYLVQKYTFSKGHQPRVDHIGGKAWLRAKTKARRAVRTMVREMLRSHARRKMLKGFSFGPDNPWQKEFEAGFEYEETPDQAKSIEDVKADLEHPKPMDRLVCGDVGYGKTEVAMRAAFKVVNDGKQVCILAPTTVLCQQHYLNFCRRFDPFPIRIEVLSRFISRPNQDKITAGLADGTVDIVIGTHRLLQKDISFHDIGLLVIDEEHRFGVKDKEKIKSIKDTVDVLSLSATPIPRTFYMAMSGLRDLSVIETPPESRLGIKTRVIPFSWKIIREAVLREMGRGGQVFFLHNRIRSIQSMARYLSSIVPEAQIAIAHGQMSERSLEKVMASFTTGEKDILLSTSIIESGLDIPNANTMIINRADRFGLADLYQLRGRIGRSAHQAYAYLMVPDGRLTYAARQRMSAMVEFSELGSGVKLAALDLEIRGAGNLLGYEQSGRMAEVGLEMYTRILEETVAELQGEPLPEKATFSHPEMITPYSAFIPDDYIRDMNSRLTTYKRLSLVHSEDDLLKIAEETEDIFGPRPAELIALFNLCSLRIAAGRAGVEKIIITPRSAEIIFSRSTKVEPARILDLIKKGQGAVTLKDSQRLLISQPGKRQEESTSGLRNILLDLVDYDRVPSARPDAPGVNSSG